MNGVEVAAELRESETTGDPWLTTHQAARRLRITKGQLRWLIATGRVSAEKVPGGPLQVMERSLARYEREVSGE